jgi:hypothetical protein
MTRTDTGTPNSHAIPYFIFRFLQFLNSYFDAPPAKARPKSASPKRCVKVPRAVSSIHCEIPWHAYWNVLSACRATHFGASVCVMRRLNRQRHTHQKSGYYNQSHIFKSRRAARVRERLQRFLQEKWEGTYRLLRPWGQTCGWSSGTRSKASGRTAVWAGSIRARSVCRSRAI